MNRFNLKRALLTGLGAVFCIGGMLWWHHSQAPRAAAPPAIAAAANSAVSGTNSPAVLAKATPAQTISHEMDLTVNPYAAGLREPGKSKRDWNAGFIQNFEQAKAGDPVKFELTRGVMA